MNEPFDALEAELEALRPREVSPRLHQQIAGRLEHVSASWRKGLAWSAVLAGGIAAGVALAAFLWRGGDQPRLEEPVRITPPPPVPSPAARDDRLPTVLAYHQALAESPAAFEALLDKHARMWSVSAQPVQRANLWMPYTSFSDRTGDP